MIVFLLKENFRNGNSLLCWFHKLPSATPFPSSRVDLQSNIHFRASCYFSVISGHTILEEYSCGQEDIEYNVTLRGGQYAGIFKDQGQVKNMQECMHLCCNSKKCDVAMMHGPKCFSVQCLNDSSCETIPADREDIDMQIAHMTTKGTGQLSMCLHSPLEAS